MKPHEAPLLRQSGSPTGRLINRSAALEARRAEFAERATAFDFASLCTAPPLQLRAFDEAIGDLHDSVGVANHEIYGDPLPPTFYGVRLQRRGQGEMTSGQRAHQVAADGLSGAATRLPHLDAIQRSFGAHDVTGIQAHTDGRAQDAARQLHAHGYASGDAVAFASSPDLFTAAHEAAHVVQQRAGVALSDGLGRAGDVYERHADEVAGLVVRGESAEATLSRMVGAGRAANSESLVSIQLQAKGSQRQTVEEIQRKIDEDEIEHELWRQESKRSHEPAPKSDAHMRVAKTPPGAADSNTRDRFVEEAETYVGGEAIIDTDANGKRSNRYRGVRGSKSLDGKTAGVETQGRERYERVQGGTKTTTVTREEDVNKKVESRTITIRVKDREATARQAQTQLQTHSAALKTQASLAKDDEAKAKIEWLALKERDAKLARAIEENRVAFRKAQGELAASAEKDPASPEKQAELRSRTAHRDRALRTEREQIARDIEVRKETITEAKVRHRDLDAQARRVDLLARRLDDPDQLHSVARAAAKLPSAPGSLKFEWVDQHSKSNESRGKTTEDGRTEEFAEKKLEATRGNKKLEQVEKSTRHHGLDKENLGFVMGEDHSTTKTRTGIPSDGGVDQVDSEAESRRTSKGVSLVQGAHFGESSEKRVQNADGSGSNEAESSGWSGAEGLYDKKSSARTDAQGNAWERSSEVGADRSGVKGKIEAARGKEGDVGGAAHLSGKVRRSADGSFTVVVTPVKNDHLSDEEKAQGLSAHYKVVTTIRVGAGVGADGSASRQSADANTHRGGDGKLGGSVDGSLSATYTHTRRLTLEEARVYLAKVDQVEASGKSGSLPEFDSWAKAKAWARDDGRSLKGLASAAGNSSSARAMKEGEAMSFEIEGRGGANGKVESGGLSGGVSASISGKRTVTVKRWKGDIVDIEVGFASDNTLGAEGGARMGVVGGKVAGQKASSKGRAVTFRLDASAEGYDAKFERIARALSREELEHLRGEFAKEVIADKRSKGESEDRSGQVTVGLEKLSLGFDVGDGGAKSEEVDLRGADSSGEFTGESRAGAHVAGTTPLGKVALGTKKTDKSVAKVNEQGELSVKLTSEETTSRLAWPEALEAAKKSPNAIGDAGMAADEALVSAKERCAKREVPSAEEVMRKSEGAYDLADGARAKMAKSAELLAASDTYLQQVDLTQSDVSALTARATGSMAEWQSHAAWSSPAALDAWIGLRGRLVRPELKPDEVESAGPDKAAQFGRGRAVADFVKGAGGKGRLIVLSALRNWGAGAYGGGLRHEELGHVSAFPPSLKKLAKEWEDWHADVAKVGATFETLERTAAGQQKAQTLSDSLSLRSDTMRRAIEGASDFSDPRERAEMLARLSAANEKRRAHYQSFMVDRGQEEGVKVDTKTFSEENTRRRMSELVGILAGLKQDETRLFGEVKDALGGLWEDWSTAQILVGRIDASYRFWIARIRELRAMHTQARTPASAWRVSAGPGKPRKRDLEPDVDQLYMLLKHGERDVEALKRIERKRAEYLGY